LTGRAHRYVGNPAIFVSTVAHGRAWSVPFVAERFEEVCHSLRRGPDDFRRCDASAFARENLLSTRLIDVGSPPVWATVTVASAVFAKV